jgi:hypothetical protein
MLPTPLGMPLGAFECRRTLYSPMAKKILSIPVSCFKCGRGSCIRSSRKTFKRAFMRMLGWHLWQCTSCGTRFYLRRKGYEPQIGGADGEAA